MKSPKLFCLFCSLLIISCHQPLDVSDGDAPLSATNDISAPVPPDENSLAAAGLAADPELELLVSPLAEFSRLRILNYNYVNFTLNNPKPDDKTSTDNALIDVIVPQIHCDANGDVIPSRVKVFVHGGGFIGGDKADWYSNVTMLEVMKIALQNNYAIVNINYPLLKLLGEEAVGMKKCFSYTRWALRVVAHYADLLYLKMGNVQLVGASAGSGIVLWLGLQDETYTIKRIDCGVPQATYKFSLWDDYLNEYTDYPEITEQDIIDILKPDYIARLVGYTGDMECFDPANYETYQDAFDMYNLYKAMPLADRPIIHCSSNTDGDPRTALNPFLTLVHHKIWADTLNGLNDN
jgi:acetyl esterase/lipase